MHRGVRGCLRACAWSKGVGVCNMKVRPCTYGRSARVCTPASLFMSHLCSMGAPAPSTTESVPGLQQPPAWGPSSRRAGGGGGLPAQGDTPALARCRQDALRTSRGSWTGSVPQAAGPSCCRSCVLLRAPAGSEPARRLDVPSGCESRAATPLGGFPDPLSCPRRPPAPPGLCH